MRKSLFKKQLEKLFQKSPKIFFLCIGIFILFLGLFLFSFSGNNEFSKEISIIFILFGALITLISSTYIVVVYLIKKKKEKTLNEALLSTGINQIDSLSPFEFEDWVTRFLNINGFKAITTKRSGDFGADVIAYKDNKKLVVSCKKYVGNLGIKCVQEIIGAMDYYHATEGWVVSTSSHFSKQAYDLAKSRGVKLYTKEKLALMLNELQKEKQIY